MYFDMLNQYDDLKAQIYDLQAQCNDLQAEYDDLQIQFGYLQAQNDDNEIILTETEKKLKECMSHLLLCSEPFQVERLNKA